jgi:hypothetical protein
LGGFVYYQIHDPMFGLHVAVDLSYRTILMEHGSTEVDMTMLLNGMEGGWLRFDFDFASSNKEFKW